MRLGTLRSFQPNYEHLADPVQRVRQALERNALHLLTAVALVPPQGEGRPDALVESLRGGRPMDLYAFACLDYLTNVDLSRDATRGAWWSRCASTSSRWMGRARGGAVAK
jgi:hypothetical protein